MNRNTMLRTLLALAVSCCLLMGSLGAVFAVELPEDETLNGILQDIQDLINRYGPQIHEEVSRGTYAGTRIHYIAPEGASYVAIGDASVRETATYATYGSQVPAALGITEDKVTNLGKKELLIEAAVAEVIDPNAQTVAGADLVTLGFSANGFALMTLDEVLREDDEPTYLDWNRYLPPEGVEEVRQILGRMKDYLVSAGVDGNYSMPGMTFNVADSLVSAAESFAFGTLAYATNLPLVIQRIQELNPHATVVIVGMDNPLDGSSVKLNDGQSMELGNYVDQLIGYISQISQSVVLEKENTVFIPAIDAANENDGKELKDTEMLLTYTPQHIKKTLPNEEGQAYITRCILNGFWLRGDADHNGEITVNDAMAALRSTVGIHTFTPEGIAACDLDGVPGVGINDAILILRASVGLVQLN